MNANELIRTAFGRIGFVPGDDTNPDGNAYYWVRNPADRTQPYVYVYAADADGNADGPPRTGSAVLIETAGPGTASVTGRAVFPDPVSAYTFVRFVSGWVAG